MGRPTTRGRGGRHLELKPGVYIRGVSGPRDAEPTRLPKAVIEHLEALGYADPEPD